MPATSNLRLSAGFTRLVPSILVVIGCLGAVGRLSQVLEREWRSTSPTGSGPPPESRWSRSSAR